MRRFLGIYLAYYPRYVDDCSKFRAFLLSMDSNAHFVVVCNSEVENLFHDRYPIVVRGDNSYREFSGWDVGIRAAHEALGDLDKFTVVFANDTFRAHNNFGWISRFAFRRAFLDAREEKSPPAISGEVWHFDGHYEIDSLRADKWVATYLFSISGSLLSKIHELAPAGHASRFYAAHEFPLHFATTISENLALHINRWLTGGSNTSWKNHAGAAVDEIASLQGKAMSIICEKYISAKVLSLGGVVVDVFESKWIRRLRRLETLYARGVKNIKRLI